MIKLLFLSVVMIAIAPKSYPQNNPDQIIGCWMSTENNLEVEIFKTGNNYKARVVWFDDSDDKARPMNTRCDWKNPDENSRTRKIIGMEVMHGLVYKEEYNDWEDGRIYDPHNGKDWNAKACFTNTGLLKVRGYWGLPLLGKDIFFKKILAMNFLTTTK
ncbi:MAG: DUF2147 domain-containing protein [Ginsengibacter sp.]